MILLEMWLADDATGAGIPPSLQAWWPLFFYGQHQDFMYPQIWFEIIVLYMSRFAINYAFLFPSSELSVLY